MVAVLSAYAFSMMGGMMGKRWFLGAALFGMAAVAMGAFPNWQFIILGITWAIVQFVAGVDAEQGHLYILTIDRDPWNARFVEPQNVYSE